MLPIIHLLTSRRNHQLHAAWLTQWLNTVVLRPHAGLWWPVTMIDKLFPSAVYQIRNSIRNDKQ